MESLSEVLRDKRVLIYAETPYQALSACCVAIECGKVTKRIDLIMQPRFKDAHNLSARIDDANFFDSVYCSEHEYARGPQRLFLSLLKEGRKKRENAAKRFYDSYPQTKGRDYDILMDSYPHSPLFDAKEVVGKNSVTWFIDDGVGSRTGGVFTPLRCVDDVFGDSSLPMGVALKAKTAFKKMFRKPLNKHFGLSIEGIAIFCATKREVDLYRNISVANIKIPEDVSLLCETLAPRFSSATLAGKKVIFLATSNSPTSEFLDGESKIVKTLHEHLGDLLVVRPHPLRNIDDERLSGLPLVPAEDPWEIMVMSGLIGDNTILVACSSTAQMSPKMLADAEPYLIFTSAIMPRSGADYKSSGTIYSMMKEQYCNPKKVFMPKDVDELLSFVTEAVKQN